MKLENFLTSFIIEEASQKGKGLTVFDIDETLFKTYAKILVKKDGKIVKELSNAEYNSYKLQPGESFDFDQFRDAALFSKTSRPIWKNINKLITITRKAEMKGSKVILLTARSDFKDKEPFLDTFRKHGIPIDQIYVERAGNLTTGSIALAKRKIITKYLSNGDYRRVRLYDDFLQNCLEFLELEKELPSDIENKIREKWNVPPDEKAIEFFAYLIHSDGSANRIK